MTHQQLCASVCPWISSQVNSGSFSSSSILSYCTAGTLSFLMPSKIALHFFDGAVSVILTN